LVCLDPEKKLRQIECGSTINRPGASGTEKDQESLEPKKTRTGRVWDRKRRGESGTEKENTEQCRTGKEGAGEFGTGREGARRV
jgi:hypothetical protein